MGDVNNLSGLALPGDPVVPDESSTKRYVDTQVATRAESAHTHNYNAIGPGSGYAQVAYTITAVARTSTTTLSDVTRLSFTNLLARQYALEGQLFYNAPTAADMRVGFTTTNLNTPSFWSLMGAAVSATAATGAQFDVSARPLNNTGDVGGTGANAIVLVAGSLYFGLPGGSLTLRFAQATSSTTATTLLGGSWLRLTELGS